MKIIIVSEKNNPHMGRREMIIYVDHIAGATPSRLGLQQLAAKEFNTDLEKIEIKNIFSSVGKQQSRARIFIWDQKQPQPAPKEKKEETKTA